MVKLKCWKRTLSKNAFVGSKDNRFINIYKFTKGQYRIEAYNDGKRVVEKRFKSKPQAFKFAKLYMKKHNSC